MERIAKYFIAQHIADPFRNEPRNVGVFVAIGNERTARFIGADIATAKVDGKKTKFAAYPDVYKQWVAHWWTMIQRSDLALAELLKSSKDNYRVIEGGEVAHIGMDSVHEVATYLYASLVTDNLA